MTTVRRSLGVPPFFCPLPDVVYDKPDEIDAGAAAWMFRQGFRKEGDWLPKMKAGSYTAHCMPYVLDRCAEIITYFPITLDAAARAGAFTLGDLILIVGFGGGMSVGFALVEW